MTKEENFKLHKNALYGKSVYKILEERTKILNSLQEGIK